MANRRSWPTYNTIYRIAARRSFFIEARLIPTQHRCLTTQRSCMDGLDPFAYTSGRWLRDDEAQRNARRITFDIEALCRRVIELCPGASAVAGCEKKEGGFNRVFVFTTDTGRRLVARLPFALAGPPRLTTRSEVATIQYVQGKTSVPIPKILDWCDDASGPIGAEYLILEHADGVQLQTMWPTMAVDQKIRCIKAIYQRMKEVASLDLPAYGSLYHKNSVLDLKSAIPVDENFSVGPHCGSMHWDCNPMEPRSYQHIKPNHGPWSDLLGYVDGLIDAGIARVPTDAALPHQPRFRGMPRDHLALLDSGRVLLKNMSKDPRIRTASTPMLFHPDLNMRNIFVREDDPTVITAIIDWQSASIEPAFWYADDIPDFAKCTPNSPDHVDHDGELCSRAANACIQFLMPKLAFSMMLEDTLLRPFRYCYRTWKDGAVAFRHELIETSLQWGTLGLSGSWPLTVPASDEMKAHQAHYRKFVAAQDLKCDLSSLLNASTDGWVPYESWDATQVAHKDLFTDMLAAVLNQDNMDNDEPIRTEADLIEIWPFDLDMGSARRPP